MKKTVKKTPGEIQFYNKSVGKIVWNRIRYAKINWSDPLGQATTVATEVSRRYPLQAGFIVRKIHPWLGARQFRFLAVSAIFQKDFKLLEKICTHTVGLSDVMNHEFIADLTEAYLALTFSGHNTIDQFIELVTDYQFSKREIEEIVLRAFQTLQGARYACPDNKLGSLKQELLKLEKLVPNLVTRVAVSESLFSERNERTLSSKLLNPPSVFEFSDPDVAGQRNLKKRYVGNIPGFFLNVAKEVTVIDANLVLQGDRLLNYDEAAAPADNHVAGVWLFAQPISADHKTALVLNFTDKIVKLKCAILISGRVPENYFHWLIEYLPKMVAFELDPANLRDCPIIIQDNVAPQLLESLLIVMEKLNLKNEIVPRSSRTQIQVEKLFIPTNPIISPDLFDRTNWWTGSALSEFHLKFLRRMFLPKERNPKFPKKIYLSRRGRKSRGILNIKDVENILKSHGYEFVYPEALSFLEQIELFHNADKICAAGGAAFSNLLFCAPGTQVLGLVANGNKNYCMQANLANYAGCHFQYVVGPEQYPREYYLNEVVYIHASFSVDLAQLKRTLTKIG